MSEHKIRPGQNGGTWAASRAWFEVVSLPLEAAPEPPAAALPPNPKAAFGAQKPDLSLIPPSAGHHEALAFENGAGKYGAYNWRDKAVEARTYVAAAQRHIADWLDGQEFSSDAGVHNLGHARACLAILIDAQEQGNLIDNRPIKGKSAQVLERLKAWKIERAKAEGQEVPEPLKVGDRVECVGGFRKGCVGEIREISARELQRVPA